MNQKLDSILAELTSINRSIEEMLARDPGANAKLRRVALAAKAILPTASALIDDALDTTTLDEEWVADWTSERDELTAALKALWLPKPDPAPEPQLAPPREAVEELVWAAQEMIGQFRLSNVPVWNVVHALQGAISRVKEEAGL